MSHRLPFILSATDIESTIDSIDIDSTATDNTTITTTNTLTTDPLLILNPSCIPSPPSPSLDLPIQPIIPFDPSTISSSLSPLIVPIAEPELVGGSSDFLPSFIDHSSTTPIPTNTITTNSTTTSTTTTPLTPIVSTPSISHTPHTLYTRIHGQWYDLRPFLKKHPGGPFALSMIAGRDGTILFESYHALYQPDKMISILSKYKVPSHLAQQLRTIEQDTPHMPSVDNLFDWPVGGSPFANDLKAVVRDYFINQAKLRNVSFRDATKGTPLRFLQQIIMSILFITSLYVMMYSTCLPSIILCPFFAWLLAANVFHDASHFAITVNPMTNKWISYLFPYFMSPTTWALQHIIGHHAYPNLPNLDPDINHTRLIRRDHPKLPWLQAHSEQGFWYRLIPHFILATTFGLNIANEIDIYTTNNYNDAVPVGPRTSLRHYLHILGRFMTIFTILSWPFIFHRHHLPLYLQFAYALIPSFIFSFLFMINSQVNHLTPSHITAYSRDWYKHQIITAQNFGPRSWFHFILSGGLNHQIEHHLFPGINHCHLPNLQPKILAVCDKHGVKYTMASGYIEAIRNYINHTWICADKPKSD